MGVTTSPHSHISKTKLTRSLELRRVLRPTSHSQRILLLLLHVQFLCRALETRRAAAVARVATLMCITVSETCQFVSDFRFNSSFMLFDCSIWSVEKCSLSKSFADNFAAAAPRAIFVPATNEALAWDSLSCHPHVHHIVQRSTSILF